MYRKLWLETSFNQTNAALIEHCKSVGFHSFASLSIVSWSNINKDHFFQTFEQLLSQNSLTYANQLENTFKILCEVYCKGINDLFIGKYLFKLKIEILPNFNENVIWTYEAHISS